MSQIKLKTFNKSVMHDFLGDDEQSIKEYQIAFLKQVKEIYPQLIIYFNQENWQELKQKAHYLKTSAKAIGAELTAEILCKLECNADSSDQKQCQYLIKQLKGELEKLYGVIKHGISS